MPLSVPAVSDYYSTILSAMFYYTLNCQSVIKWNEMVSNYVSIPGLIWTRFCCVYRPFLCLLTTYAPLWFLTIDVRFLWFEYNQRLYFISSDSQSLVIVYFLVRETYLSMSRLDLDVMIVFCPLGNMNCLGLHLSTDVCRVSYDFSSSNAFAV